MIHIQEEQKISDLKTAVVDTGVSPWSSLRTKVLIPQILGVSATNGSQLGPFLAIALNEGRSFAEVTSPPWRVKGLGSLPHSGAAQEGLSTLGLPMVHCGCCCTHITAQLHLAQFYCPPLQGGSQEGTSKTPAYKFPCRLSFLRNPNYNVTSATSFLKRMLRKYQNVPTVIKLSCAGLKIFS